MKRGQIRLGTSGFARRSAGTRVILIPSATSVNVNELAILRGGSVLREIVSILYIASRPCLPLSNRRLRAKTEVDSFCIGPYCVQIDFEHRRGVRKIDWVAAKVGPDGRLRKDLDE